MAQQEQPEWDLWGISQEDWEEHGWRRTLEEAVDAALADKELGEPYELQIFARRRTRNSVHDYRVAT